MKEWGKGFPLIFSALIAAYSGSSSADSQIDLYLGADLQWNVTSIRDEWKPMLRSHHPGANAYFGVRPHENFGVELGYSWTTRKAKTNTVANGATFASLVNNANASRTVSSKIRLLSTDLDFVAYLPMQNSWELLAYVGAGWAKIKPTFTVSTSGSNLDALTTLKDKTRIYPRIGIGAQGLLTENLGIRFKVGCNHLNKVKFKNLTTITLSENIMKNSYFGGVGLYYYI